VAFLRRYAEYLLGFLNCGLFALNHILFFEFLQSLCLIDVGVNHVAGHPVRPLVKKFRAVDLSQRNNGPFVV
jgi:hypothetical protein